MNDRELLELAAKAAEVTGGWGEKIEYHNGAVDLRDVWILEGDDFVPWNPLDDDGDALRLAVKLAIEISPCPEHDSVLCEPKGSPDSIITTEALDDYGTRRAIVRAAAEIGRTK